MISSKIKIFNKKKQTKFLKYLKNMSVRCNQNNETRSIKRDPE